MEFLILVASCFGSDDCSHDNRQVQARRPAELDLLESLNRVE